MSERTEVDFDHHDPAFHEQRHREWAQIRRCPVAYNPRYGGFWAVSGHAEATTVARGDGATFSQRYEPEPVDGIDYLGILGVPKTDRVLGVGLAEVPESLHAPLRRALNPFFSPGAANALRPSVERDTAWLLDQVIESGAADLVADLTAPVAALITMELIGLPRGDWHYYAEMFSTGRGAEPGSAAAERLRANMATMAATLMDEVADRRRTPRDDLLTALVQFRKVDGQPLSDAELIGQLWFLVGGGLDTTSSTTALALEHLARHPELRQRLIDEPGLLGSANEEYLRYFVVNEHGTRTVVEDVEVGGQQLHRGDHVMVSWLAANRDDSVFDRPDEVVLDRVPNPHLTFGTGAYRCIGMHLARLEFQVVVAAALDRIPDYEVAKPGMQLTAPNPLLTGVTSLPVTFTPGQRSGLTERPF